VNTQTRKPRSVTSNPCGRGQLGRPRDPAKGRLRGRVLGGEGVLGVCSGLYHCAAATEKGLYTWGSNSSGQLGREAEGVAVGTPGLVEGVGGVVEVVALGCGALSTTVHSLLTIHSSLFAHCLLTIHSLLFIRYRAM